MILRELNLAAVAYVANNLRQADVRELRATQWGDFDPDALAFEVMRSYKGAGPGWSVYDRDGVPVAMFGATQPWPGMFSAWLLATPEFGRVGLGLTKFVRKVFVPHLQGRAHRVEARSIDGHEDAHRWLRTLGAEATGRDQAYGRNGEDFLVFTLPGCRNAVSVDRNDDMSTHPSTIEASPRVQDQVEGSGCPAAGG